MTTDQMNPKPRRLWLQFSVRTLLVLMLMLGCGFGWLAYQIKQTRQQRKAAAAIKKLGGQVEYLSVSRIPTVMVWFGKLFGEDLSGDVTGVRITGTRVSDAWLSHLQGLTQLRVLVLDNNQVTDVGLEQLRGLTQLRVLYLYNTQLSDAGLTHLQRLTRLRTLYLRNTQVTDAGVAELQKALPNCKINR